MLPCEINYAPSLADSLIAVARSKMEVNYYRDALQIKQPSVLN